MKYTIGLDYGTDSLRTVLVNASTGKEEASTVMYYPRWKEGKYCDPLKNQFRQHPLDYIEVLEKTIREVISKVPADVAENIVALSVDTTGSTPVAVDASGIPLSLLPDFQENPNAMFVLWKDHTAVKEADEINNLARSWGGVDYTKYEGGIYSSEWFWAKILKVLRTDEKVRQAAYSWVEHCDWIPALLTGITDPLKLKRSRCAAGHKAMWHADWDGLPSDEFLTKLDPLLKGLRGKLYRETYTSDVVAGYMTHEWKSKLGLSGEIALGVGAFDAHLGAVGGEIRPYYLVKVMGTSTCDMLVAPKSEIGENLVQGICGQVEGSITPGLVGLEAGQSAFGDIYAWFKEILMWPVENILGKTDILSPEIREKLVVAIEDQIIPQLSAAAEEIPIEETGIVAIDWMNGRRTPDANQNLKGSIAGLTLGSDAPRIFKALVEATAFGAKKIADRFMSEGVRIDGVIALGGVAKKSPFVMQIVADVMNMPIKVARSEQACALGTAMAAAVVGGVYKTFEEAQNKMGSGFEKEYKPIKANAEKYETLYRKYSKLGEFIEKEL
ncbi:MAG: ribulokinase [Bacteroidales bacterium]|nr:ribulokinase [Bacteroidales bacterium]